MKFLSKLMLTLTVLSAPAMSDEPKAQYGRTTIDLENVDYRLDVAEFYSEVLLVATSRDCRDSIRDVSVAVEHPAEVLKRSTLMYQVDTLSPRKNETGILYPELRRYIPVMWQSKPAAARLGDYGFECVGMVAAPDGSLVLVSARTDVDKEAAEALKQLMTDKYGAPKYRESRDPFEKCRWQTDDECIQLEICDNEDELEIKLFRWQKKNRDMLITYRLFEIFFEQSEGNYYPV